MNNASKTVTVIPEHVLEIVTTRASFSDDRGWIPWAWGVVSAAGDVPAIIDDEHPEYPRHLFKLAGLVHLRDLYMKISSGGDASDEPLIELHDDVRPGLTSIEIARFCEKNAIYDTVEPETEYGLVVQAVSDQARETLRRLRDLLGEDVLFTSLALADRDEFPDEEIDGASPLATPGTDKVVAFSSLVLDTGLSDAKSRTYMWLGGHLDVG